MEDVVRFRVLLLDDSVDAVDVDDRNPDCRGRSYQVYFLYWFQSAVWEQMHAKHIIHTKLACCVASNLTERYPSPCDYTLRFEAKILNIQHRKIPEISHFGISNLDENTGKSPKTNQFRAISISKLQFRSQFVNREQSQLV